MTKMEFHYIFEQTKLINLMIDYFCVFTDPPEQFIDDITVGGFHIFNQL